ncbi:30S ribosomal protein S8 [bacterium HR34]|nr:30S ribosomal protein S8 [bacterium HR34]
MLDLIVDFLNRIRNAQMAQKSVVYIPFSNLKYEIASLLERENFIDKVERRERKGKKFIKIYLKYTENKQPAISGLRRISKQGQRIYAGYDEISKYKKGYGIVVLTTSKGILTDKEARKEKVGGELICEVW